MFWRFSHPDNRRETCAQVPDTAKNEQLLYYFESIQFPYLRLQEIKEEKKTITFDKSVGIDRQTTLSAVFISLISESPKVVVRQNIHAEDSSFNFWVDDIVLMFKPLDCVPQTVIFWVLKFSVLKWNHDLHELYFHVNLRMVLQLLGENQRRWLEGCVPSPLFRFGLQWGI